MNVDAKQSTFDHCANNCKATYDAGLLAENLPPTWGVLNGDANLLSTVGNALPEDTRVAFENTNFVGVFGRILEKKGWGGGKCLQYLYVWDYQAVPAHEADYEPIFVFLDGNHRHVIYDLVHYCSRRLDLKKPGQTGPGLRMIPGWHSFLPAPNLEASDLDRDIHVKPLTDRHLDTWWNIPELEPRLKIRRYLLDPYDLEAPGHFMDEPDEASLTMCCTFLEIENALAEFEDPKQGLVEGIKRALTRCIGLFALHRLPALIQLLSEMSQVGLVAMPAPISSVGMNLAAVGNLLRDGFLNLTNAGRSFFESFGRASQSDD
ncbi:hypothetical protein EU520_01675 [Candidatus Thorarchaeota archaeon]|nr:MAG: hypothetical protein EU520_01675 [Candidatus Thorarchaeota archaeon]